MSQKEQKVEEEKPEIEFGDLLKRGEKTRLVEEDRQWCEHTKHANLARQTAGGQRWFSVVVVVRADVVPQVGGATGHPKGGGTEEARAERACVRRSRGEEVCGVSISFYDTPCHYS